MKKLLKVLIFVLGILFCSLIIFSVIFSNEKSLSWFISSVVSDSEYTISAEVSSINWQLYKSSILVDSLKIRSVDNETRELVSLQETVLDIDFIDLLFFKPFLKVSTQTGLLVLDQSTDYKGLYSTSIFNFLSKRTHFSAEKISFSGSVKAIDVYDYYSFFSNSVRDKSISQLEIKDLNIDNLTLGPLSLENVLLGLRSSKEGLMINLSNSNLRGLVYLKQPIFEGIEINLDYLNIITKDLFTTSNRNLFLYLLDFLVFPITFSTTELNIDNESSGEWRFSIHQKKNSLVFDQIQVSYKNLLVGGIDLVNKKKSSTNLSNGDESKQFINLSLVDRKETHNSVLSISRYAGKLKTDFKGKISTENLNKSLELLNPESTESSFIAKEAYIVTDISWEGLPNEFNLEDIEGSLAFKIEDLFIKEIGKDISKATGILKLINLFNVTHTFEGLTNLNFRRNFGSGFQADRVEGLLNIDSKKIKTIKPIIFHTGSGKFSWRGYVRKNSEGEFNELDFEVVMTLPIKDYLPAYALIIGGPITAGLVYIAGKAFEKPLNKLSSGKWRVSGKIDSPNSEFLEWFE